ncbi:hypothetical protein PAXINDRAFT_160453 [Paxillus involutus ATCC 200175]|nr:hypothetical protein PAXINDRAFT_160453 [Paxillus involutus ATCC 200175]
MASVPAPPPLIFSQSNPVVPEVVPEKLCNSFKTEYHPKSARPPVIDSFSTYGQTSATTPPIIDPKPWQPFLSHVDFEFAELAHDAALSKDQTNQFLQLIWKISHGPSMFSFKSHADIAKAWECSCTQMTPFKHHTIPVNYKKEELEFDILAMDMLQDPLLAPHFMWDVQHLYKHNGERFKHFIHEPWTVDCWWKLQSILPRDNSAPFALILYADKTHLSSSGGVKGHPVIACCTNLPIDSAESGKPAFMNLKCIVWHVSFLKLLETISTLSRTGFSHKCYNGITCWLFPLILILSVDYEEQCVCDGADTGLNSYCPCPICLVPHDQLYDHSQTWPIWTVEDAKVQIALWHKNHSTREEHLKEQGLQPVKNYFWIVRYSSPHEILTFDPLHVDDIGFWSEHLFSQLKQRFDALGCMFEKKLDDQHATFPCWQNFNHFNKVTNILFSDGNKLLDISKQILYMAQNILTHMRDPAGYALLMCITSHLRYHMYILLNIHTESTLAAGEAEIHVFQKRLEASHTNIQDNEKRWNFPKVHSIKHAFSDIQEKGAFTAVHVQTKHSMVRELLMSMVHRHTHIPQILRLDHKTYVAQMICSQVNYLDDSQHECILNQTALEDDESETLVDTIEIQDHLYLGSACRPATFAEVEATGSSNCYFLNFRKKFTTFINNFAHANNIIFHGHKRCDCALVRTQDKDQVDHNIFVHLLFMFKYTVSDQTLDLALVQPMDLPMGSRRSVD